jgi:hypothetical protein
MESLAMELKILPTASDGHEPARVEPRGADSARQGARLYSARLEARAFGSGRLGLCPSLAGRGAETVFFFWCECIMMCDLFSGSLLFGGLL